MQGAQASETCGIASTPPGPPLALRPLGTSALGGGKYRVSICPFIILQVLQSSSRGPFVVETPLGGVTELEPLIVYQLLDTYTAAPDDLPRSLYEQGKRHRAVLGK